MVHDHVCFAIFLVLLFIAPELPLGAVPDVGASSLVSLSPGFLGLIVWLVVSPSAVLYLPRRSSWALAMVYFALYGWLVSAFSGNIVSLLYASQYLFYTLLGFLVLRRYLARAHARGELGRSLKILIAIGIAYSIGILVSVFTGPIYPHQVHWTMRLAQGNVIPRGVGFADNPNSAGGILAFFFAASAFLCPFRSGYCVLPLALSSAGILATFSRSAIVSLVGGYSILVGIQVLRCVLRRRIILCRPTSVRTGIIILCLISCTLCLLNIWDRALVRDILFGLGISEGQSLARDLIERMDIWRERGLDLWLAHGWVQALFGLGFRNSMIMSGYGTWQTAHNFYISVLVEFGIIGLLGVSIALLGALSGIARRVLSGGGNFDVNRFTLVALSAQLIHNMTETFLYSPKYVVLLLFVLILAEVTRYNTTLR